MKKKVFIGSSSQAKEKATIVDYILRELEVETTLWWIDPQTFIPGTVTIDSLIRAANEYDAAVFILNKDDEIAKSSPESKKYLPRDNVLIEAGMFMGVLGKESVALCTVPDIHKPSDFEGIQTIPFDVDNRDKFKARLKVWIENVRVQKCLKSNVLMLPRHDMHNYYPLDERLHISDEQYRKICRIRIMNFASNLLINPEIADIGHTPPNDIRLPSALEKIMTETEANVELILSEPNKNNLRDLQTKTANRRAGSSEGVLYSALAAMYKNLSTDTIFFECRKNPVRFHFYVMKTSMPFAIFNVEFTDEVRKYNHVKVDLYSAALDNEDERRSFVIWEEIYPENYKFFTQNFNKIKNDHQLCYSPKMSTLKRWTEYWESIKP